MGSHQGSWKLWGLVLFGAFLFAGCAGPGIFSPVTKDLATLLKEPAIQATLERWGATADITNPRVSFIFGTIGELRADGTIIRGEASGQAGTRGIDPVLLRELAAIANERREANGDPPLEVDISPIEDATDDATSEPGNEDPPGTGDSP